MTKIELRNITKSFGNFTANNDISFCIAENSVHCIVGENGAGKSTLMNILFGMIKPDEGEIIISGSPVTFASPHDAIAKKIGMVHQHFMLIDDFTVLENVILGDEPVKGISLNIASARDKLKELISKYDLEINLDEKISNLSISIQQKVEILKLLYRDSDLLIFDEPTAVLSPIEVNSFFEMVRNFKNTGKTVIVITHKLNEVKEIADKVSVLRKGNLVFETDNVSGGIDISEISSAIIGGAELLTIKSKDNQAKSGQIIVRLENISMTSNKRKCLNGLSLSLFAGEIHGIAGVEGNGQAELADIVCGIEKDFEGTAEMPAERASIVPDDRLKKGLIMEFTIGENFALKRKGNSYHSEKELLNSSEKVINSYEVHAPGPEVKLGSLSGGNQQKVVVAREISSGNEVIVFSHPTRGVDINAELFIHSQIVNERNNGKAILLISSDIEELLSLSDRLSVIYKGKLVRTYETEELSNALNNSEENSDGKIHLVNQLGKLMTGVSH